LTKLLGFDRQIKKEWLDITMELLVEGKNIREIREQQERFMAVDLPGKDARRKTRLVISRIWLDNNRNLVILRRKVLEILKENPEIDTRIFHWGMSLATYPFFRDIAAICGRLIALQGYVKVSQVHDRISKIWGERSTLTRACSRVIQTMKLWGTIENTERSALYTTNERNAIAVERQSETTWLIQSLLYGKESRSIAIEEIERTPELFPFKIEARLDSLIVSDEIEVSRQGLKMNLITLKKLVRE